MSAIVVYCDTSGIFIASDGVAYRGDGIVCGFIAKVFPIVHCNCVIAHVGAGGIGHALLYRLGQDLRDFDHLLEIGPDLVRETLAQSIAWHGTESGVNTTVVLAGWSPARQAFEAYKISSRPKKMIDSETDETIQLEAWSLTPIECVWGSSSIDPETYSTFGLDVVPIPAVEYVARLVCAARAKSGPGAEDGEYAVGGFLQMTIVGRDKVTSWVAHRWPDRVGELVDPAAGEPMPTFPMVVP